MISLLVQQNPEDNMKTHIKKNSPTRGSVIITKVRKLVCSRAIENVLSLKARVIVPVIAFISAKRGRRKLRELHK